MNEKKIYFDMDGTIADLYGVENWLDDIINRDVRPYAEAKPLVNLSLLARYLHILQNKGYKVGVITWLAKNSTDDYDERVTATKKAWLSKRLPSVEFDEIHVIKYGTPKSSVGCGILFDDEEPNRKAWIGTAYDVDNIVEVLKKLAKG